MSNKLTQIHQELVGPNKEVEVIKENLKGAIQTIDGLKKLIEQIEKNQEKDKK